jgi:hypothetical protein
MAFRKIEAGLVHGSVDDFIGKKGTIFYDNDDGTLRLSDGVTPGGNVISSGSGGSNYTLPTATTTVKGGVKIDGTTIAISNQVISVGTVPYSSLSGAPTVPTNVSQLTNDTGFITGVSWDAVTGKPTLFSGAYADLSGKPTNVSSFTNDSGYLTSSSLSSYATQSYVTSRGYVTSASIPTAVSQLSNDSNYLVEADFDLDTIDLDANNKLHATGILPGDDEGFTAVFAGRAAGVAALPNTVIQSQAQVNDYAQNNFQNTSDGVHASTEWVATSPNGDDSNYYIDFGINGASWDGTAENSLYANVGQRDGWVYVQGGNAGGGNLVLGTSLANTYTKIISGDASAGDTEVARFSSTEVKLKKQLTFNDNTTQTTAWLGTYSWNDLTDAPTIPADTGDLTNNAGFITSDALTGFATVTGEETLTNKTLTSPTINNPTFNGTFAFESNNTNQPAMTLTASVLQDGVGILRVIGSEPDINFNQVSESPGFNTFTFEWNGDAKIAMGRRNDHSFYITRNDGAWHDNTFVLDYNTGVLSVESGIAVPSIDFGEAGTQTEPFLGFGSLSLGDMGDVDLTTAPTVGQVLKYDGTKWAPGTDITSGGAGTDADTLDGFDSSYFLNYNNFTNKPSLATVATSGSYADLTNKPTIPTTVTVNGTAITLGSSGTITASTTNALTISTGLKGTASTFDGSAAVTVSLDTTVTTITATAGATTTLSAATITPNYIISGTISGTHIIRLPDLTTLTAGQRITFNVNQGTISFQLSTGTSIVSNTTTLSRLITFTVLSNAANTTANVYYTYSVPGVTGTGTSLVTNSSPSITGAYITGLDSTTSTSAYASTPSLTLGPSSSVFNHTLNILTAATAATYVKNLNIGTNLAGGTSTINIGTGVTSGTATLNLGSSSTTTTMNGAVTITSLTATDSIVGSITGNAATATKLGTARAINGVNFDGSAGITITANTPNALTIGSGLSGTSFNGSTAVTIAVDSTVALRADTHYIGTTSIALNRTSASQTLTGVSIDGNAATVTDGVYTSGTYADPAWITSLAYSKLTGTPSLFSGSYTDLTNKPTIYSGAYIGTTSLDFTRASGSQTLTGVSIDGNAATVTNGLYSTGSYANPAWLTSLAYSKLTGAPTVPTNVSQLTNDSGYATLTGAETLTNKTLTLPTIGGTGATFNGSTSGTTVLKASATAGTTTVTLPATTGTIITTGDSGTVTNTMLAGSIANAKLANSTISGVSLGSNLNALTIGTGLSGTTYNGSSAVTIAIDSTVATLTGSQTLTNKTLTLPTIGGTGATFNGSTSGTTVLKASAAAGTTTVTMPATTGTLITTGDSGTVTNTMLAGSIANSKLANSSITINGSAISLGGSTTIASITASGFSSSLGFDGAGNLILSNTNTFRQATGLTIQTGGPAPYYEWKFNNDGTTTLPSNAIDSGTNSISVKSSGDSSSSTLYWKAGTIGAGLPFDSSVYANTSGVTVSATSGTQSVRSVKNWVFDIAGQITFPDTTVQSTAYTATAVKGLFSVTTNSASGNGSLSYSNGVFTFTPASVPTSVTINGTAVTLGSSGTVTAAAGTLTGLTSSGAVSITDTTNSSNTTTGALKVSGGVGVAGNIYLGGGINATGSIYSAGANVSYSPATPTGQAFQATGKDTQGGTGYFDFFKINNTTSGGTNGSKTMRLNSVGTLEILNNAYNATILSVTDAGFISINASSSATDGVPTNNAIAMNANSYIFDDGNYHITAKTGNIWINSNNGGSVQINTQMPAGVTGGGLVVQGPVTSRASGGTTAFVSSGSNVISGVALQMDSGTAGTAANMAVRDTSTVSSTMYFDVSTGGSGHGTFQFRSSNAFTQLMSLSNSQVAVNKQMLIGGGSQGAYVTITGTNSYNLGGPYGYLSSGGSGSVGGGGASGTVGWSLQCIGRIQVNEIDATSDERLKDIQGTIPLDRALQFVRAVDGILYTWKPGFGDEGLKSGFGAQNVHKAGFDHMVAPIPNERVEGSTDADGFTSPDKFQLTLNYMEAIPYHHEVIKHLLDRIEQLEATVAKLAK